MSIRSILASALLLVGMLGPAMADGCKNLQLAASVAMTPTRDGSGMLVPITVEGTPRLLLFDTGGYMSQLTAATANDLKLPAHESALHLYDVSGNISDHYVIANQVEIGGLRAAHIPFMVITDSSNFGKGTDPFDGILSSDFLFRYDVEVDFADRKLNYFLQDHCEGKVIYWPQAGVGVVPIKVANNRIMVSIILDGQPIKALIDTGASRSTMSMPAARRLFGLTAQSPGVTESGIVNNDAQLKTYSHVFSSLSFGDVSVSNLRVLLLPDILDKKGDTSGQTENRALRNNADMTLEDMLIGMDVLKHLHLYMALKENKFYVTAASIPPSGQTK